MLDSPQLFNLLTLAYKVIDTQVAIDYQAVGTSAGFVVRVVWHLSPPHAHTPLPRSRTAIVQDKVDFVINDTPLSEAIHKAYP
jgi:hypothetical protein